MGTCQAVVARMAHRNPAIAGAATDAVRELLGSEAAAGGLARDAVRFQNPLDFLLAPSLPSEGLCDVLVPNI